MGEYIGNDRTPGNKRGLWLLGLIVPVVALGIFCGVLFGYRANVNAYEPASEQMPTEQIVQIEPTQSQEPEATLPQVDIQISQPEQNSVPYQQRVENPDQPIYAGPGYEYEYVKLIGSSGTYTIVEESRDAEDNLWGKLKSGSGWIDLTDASTYVKSVSPISLRYGRRSDLDNEENFVCIADTSQYMVVALFTANEDLKDVYLMYMDFGLYSNTPGDVCFYAEQIPAGSNLAAAVAFPGDMDSMGICFVDAGGVTRRYEFLISLMDGSLSLIER